MFVAEVWRYPVKSMAGERLAEAKLGSHGIPGDRALYVVNRRGRVVTARNRPALLRLRATVAPSGEIRVDGRPWDDPEVARRVREVAGPDARLVRAEGGGRFDLLPLLVATDGAVRALGADRRRLRPNLLIGGVPGLTERDWEGRQLRAGQAVIGLADLRGRCIMTTWDPDTGEQDVGVLLRIRREFGGRVALNAEVARSGRVAVGDGVELLPRKGVQP